MIFYEVVMAKRKDDAYLVTGNQKHFPVRPFVVTPAEMMEILEKEQKKLSTNFKMITACKKMEK